MSWNDFPFLVCESELAGCLPVVRTSQNREVSKHAEMEGFFWCKALTGFKWSPLLFQGMEGVCGNSFMRLSAFMGGHRMGRLVHRMEVKEAQNREIPACADMFGKCQETPALLCAISRSALNLK